MRGLSDSCMWFLCASSFFLLLFAVVRYAAKEQQTIQLSTTLSDRITTVGNSEIGYVDFWDADGNNVLEPEGITLHGPLGGVVPIKYGQYRITWRDHSRLTIKDGPT